MKIKFGKIEQLLAVIVIGIVVLFIYLKFSFGPTVKNYNKIHKKWTQISKEVNLLKDKEGYWRYVSKIERETKDLKQELVQILKKVLLL